ncbi:MAG: hypothetical protein IPL96_16065 [Holophagaceae bacterium]|nr:hypothetical protein [Holophagaceae bacterium]
MRPWAKAAFALGAHSPLAVVPVGLIGMLFLFPPGPVASAAEGRSIETAWTWFWIAVGASLFGFALTLFLGLIHVVRDPSLGSGPRALWLLGLLFLGGILVPLLFWTRILPLRSGDELLSGRREP